MLLCFCAWLIKSTVSLLEVGMVSGERRKSAEHC
jgi:hypothetical protein